MNWDPILLSLKILAIVVPLILVGGVGLALLLVRSRFVGRGIVETLVVLPLVLPPSVVGYYLLLMLGRDGPIGGWLGAQVLFTWPAAAIASAVVGLPLVVQASRAAIATVDPSLEAVARTLGSSEPEVLWRVTLPLARRGIIAGVILGSARALGEFGATLMIAGNIPGRTQTLPLAIYDAVQSRQYELANSMVLLLTAASFAALWMVRRLETTTPSTTAGRAGPGLGATSR